MAGIQTAGKASSEAAFLVRTSGSCRGVSTQVGFAVSEGPPGASSEPIVTDNVRVMPADSDATRHITVVRLLALKFGVEDIFESWLMGTNRELGEADHVMLFGEVWGATGTLMGVPAVSILNYPSTS